MRIGIIGAGNIGGNLGQVWAAQGHEVVFGVRDPQSSKAQAALQTVGSVRAASPEDAAAFGEVVVLAVPGNNVVEVAGSLGDLSGKIVIDTTNRVVVPEGDTGSLVEKVAQQLPGARVVKAFNTMGAETLLQPRIGSEAATAFICGDDAAAKATVIQLAREIGLDAIDAGPLAMAASVEAMARLWIALMRSSGRRDFAFRMIRGG